MYVIYATKYYNYYIDNFDYNNYNTNKNECCGLDDNDYINYLEDGIFKYIILK